MICIQQWLTASMCSYIEWQHAMWLMLLLEREHLRTVLYFFSDSKGHQIVLLRKQKEIKTAAIHERGLAPAFSQWILQNDEGKKKKKNHVNFVSPICLGYRLLIRDQFGWILKYEFRESALPKWLFQTKMAHPRRTTEMISWKNVFFKLKWLTSCWISGLGTFSFSVLTDPILCPSPKLVWRADWVIYLSFQLTRLRGLASKCLPQTKMGDFLFNFRDGCLRLFPFLLLWSTWPPNFMVIGGTVVRGRIFKCDHWLKWLEKSCFTPKCPTSCSISVMGPWNSW